MTKTGEIYRCVVCGNLVEVVRGGGGELHCCGRPMEKVEENTEDASHEKHIPVMEPEAGGWRVKVGSVEHPMLKEHYIEWIELQTKCGIQRCRLQPGDRPVAHFKTTAPVVAVRAYCNLHGLWRVER